MRSVADPYALFGLALSLAGALSACGARFDPANFQGSRGERRAEPEAVLVFAGQLSGAETVGSVSASCTLQPGFRRLEREPLSDVDCSSARLGLALRESAASAGGDALVGVQCESRHPLGARESVTRVTCSASVARFARDRPTHNGPLTIPRSLPAGEPAPSASDVRRIDEPDASLAFRIFLDFEPSARNFKRRARASGEVNEFSLLPIADTTLGQLVARCENGCDERALRRGLLVAAGRLGASDLIQVRCLGVPVTNACVGTLAAPEREE